MNEKTLLIATALTTSAYTFSSGATQEAASLVLQSLPAEAQKGIEDVRAACRDYLNNVDPSQLRSVSSGDDGLGLFTVSGMQAVMVNHLELCGGQCLRGANCSNRGSNPIIIYVRSRNTWREALSTEAVGRVFLSTSDDDPPKFKALVLSVFGGNKDCLTHDVVMREGKERYVFPAWKQSCDAVVKWNGTKFTYKRL